jgi:hypothetical protein
MISAHSECFRTNVLCQVFRGSSLSGVKYLREVKPQNVQDLVECPTLALCLLVIAAHYYHYTTGGELAIEDEKILFDDLESVSCRWCGPTGKVEEYDGSAEAS